jgi:hypothetical protein
MTTTAPRTAPPPTRNRPRGTAALRGAAGLHAALVLVQAALAGNWLAGNAVALRVHQALGTEGLTWVALATLVLAVVVWLAGRGPWWPAAIALLVAAADVVQIVLGFAGRLAVHVPLGVAIFGASLVLLIATGDLRVRPRRGGPAAPPGPAGA